MRVISGSARGTKLLCPEGLSVRPTHDRVKEALFSMLSFKIADANILDLFAGTGALGIESLSRGAAHGTFVDVSATSLKVVEENLQKTKLISESTLYKSDYLSFLENTNGTFDIIFLDPPYQEGFLLPALKKIHERRLLNPAGVIYCETEGEPPAEIALLFDITRDKKYGRARILLLKEMSL